MTGLAFAIFAFLFGAVVGSFLNVCIYRLPRGESLVYPPSHCPKCYQPILAEDNIPIVSWFLLRARCRFCHDRISPIYPVVEFLTGALFFFYYWGFLGFGEPPSHGLLAVYAVHVAFLSALIAVTVIDLRHYMVPDEISLPGTAVALAASFLLPSLHPSPWFPSHPHLSALASSALGAAVGASIIYGIGVAGKALIPKERLAFGGEAMGLGDVKLMALIGAMLGWETAILVIFASALLGTVYGLIRMSFTGDNKIPYGPFLAIAAAAMLVLRPTVTAFVADVVSSYRFLLR